MLKSLFSKLMVTYLIIMFIALALLGGLTARLFKNYYFTEKEELMISQGQEINRQVAKYLFGEITIDQLAIKLETIDHILNVRIWIVDTNGLIYEESKSTQQRWLGSKLEREDIQQIIQGRTVTKIGKFGDRFDVSMLSVIVPMIVDQEVKGATILHLPVYGIENSLVRVHKLIWAAALISVGLGSILVYFISLRFARPLHEMNSVALRLANGEFDQRVEFVGEDEIAQLGQSFNFMASQLNKLEQMRREFIANVSHELRSPLTSIRGFLQAIIDGTVAPEAQSKYLCMVFEETNRLTRLVNDLLDLAKMESGTLQLEKTCFDICEVIRQVLFKFEPQVRVRELNVSIDLPRNAVNVCADYDRIQQVLINLINNAIRYTPPGGKIAVILSMRGNKAVVTVKDTGVGIPEADLKYIWDRFHKVDKARTRSKGGTGLGLSIVKHLVDAHGERISVTSKVNEGSAFSFTLNTQ